MNLPTYSGAHGAFDVGGAVPTAYIDLLYAGSTTDPDGIYTVAEASNRTVDHELVETVTDPRPHVLNDAYTGWRDSLNGSNAEVADKCQGVTQDTVKVKLLPDTEFPNTFEIAPSWSNALADHFTPSPPNDSRDGCAWAFSDEEVKYMISGGTLRAQTSPGAPWNDLGAPPGRTLKGTPAGRLAYGSDGHLWLSVLSSETPIWFDMGPPPEGSFFQSPAGTSFGAGYSDFFAVTSGNGAKKLWSRRIFLSGTTHENVDTGWISWGSPPEGIASGPGVYSILGPLEHGFLTAYVVDDGSTRRISTATWATPGTGTPTWTRDAIDAPAVLKTVNPGAAIDLSNVGHSDLFIPDADGNVLHRAQGFPNPPGQITWENLGKPSGKSVTQQVGVLIPGTRQLKIAAAAGGQVWERVWFVSDGGWSAQGGNPVSSSGTSIVSTLPF